MNSKRFLACGDYLQMRGADVDTDGGLPVPLSPPTVSFGSRHPSTVPDVIENCSVYLPVASINPECYNFVKALDISQSQ